MDFEGKRILVTGASSGIGAAAAELFIEQGAKVFAVARSQEKLSALAEKLGPNFIPHIADVGDQTQTEAMVEAGVAALGGLDVLVNNAGTGGALKRVGDLDPAEWRRGMSTNLDSVFWACRVALPHLLESKGCIVNTASLASLAADYSFVTYTVSKTALVALTRSMALDYAADGVRVNCISPGFVLTDLNKNAPPAMNEAFIARTPIGRAGTAREIADSILFLASPKASFISGHNLVIDGATMATAGLPNVPAIIAEMMKGR